MPAIDTIAGVATIGAGPVFTAVTMATGDSNTVRSFPQGTGAWIFDAVFAGPHKGQLRVRSARLHDSNTGIIISTSEDPSTHMWPWGVLQPVYSADQLTIELDGTAADVDSFALMIYYQQAGGLSARLSDWGTVKPLIYEVKPFVTAITNSGTAGTWTDTVITTTDNQLVADADYAVIGMTTDTAMTAMAVKGADTSTLRCGVPASTVTGFTSRYFANMADETGMPCIPIIAANNRASTYVSTIDDTASSTANVTLWLAELSTSLPPAL